MKGKKGTMKYAEMKICITIQFSWYLTVKKCDLLKKSRKRELPLGRDPL